MASLVLASTSPRRWKLVCSLGIAARTWQADLPEDVLFCSLSPRDRARRLAEAKALAAIIAGIEGPVLAGDTIVDVGGESVGKPGDVAIAQAMLRKLSGKAHTVHTGVALALPSLRSEDNDREGVGLWPLLGLPPLEQHEEGGHAIYSTTLSTEVVFRELTSADIEAYIATGEPLDKAGAYAIQGWGASLIARWTGCFSNAVGLPLCATTLLLSHADISIDLPKPDRRCTIPGDYPCLLSRFVESLQQMA